MAFDLAGLAAVPDLAKALAAGETAALRRLRDLRDALAASLLDGTADPVAACAHPGFMALVEAGLPRFATEARAATLGAKAMSRPDDPAARLAALLLVRPHDLPAIPDLAALPEATRAVAARALLVAPALFEHVGEGERYAERAEAVVDAFHRAVVGRRADPARLPLGILFAQHANLLMAYFSTRNLSRMFRRRAEIVEALAVSARRLPAHAWGARRPGRLRVGILTHALRPFTETYLALSQYETPDPDIDYRVYVFAEAPGPIADLTAARAGAPVVLPADMSEQIRRIRADDLDVLAIHTNVSAVVNPSTLLAACRLARVQVVSSATPTTVGFAAGDVYLSGDANEPGSDPQADYAEVLHRMPGFVNYYAFHHDRDPASISVTRAELGLDPAAPVFFSGANFFKMVPELTALWAKLLADVPQAQLLIMPFAPSWSASYFSGPFFDRLRAQFAAAGVDPSRWKAAPPVPTRADLHRIASLCDVYLDAHPFSGACSLIDPLSVGLPVVTLAGTRFRGHVGAAMLAGAGLGDFVAADEADYLAKAAALARDPAARARAAARVRAAMAPTMPYFDTAAAGRKFADACRTLAAARDRRLDGLRARAPDALRAAIARLSTALAGKPLFQALTDNEIVRLFALPYLADAAPGGHALDVGACFGETALPFLEAGWTADLFEPDPACAPAMAELARRHPGRVNHHALLVAESAGDLPFFRTDTGLSGRSPSAFAATKDVATLPAVRLDGFARARGLPRVDWLKVDCEGFDFDALLSHDFAALPPKLALAEFTTAHPRQDAAAVAAAIAAMAAHGYAALVFCCEDAGNFRRRVWDYWCVAVTNGALVPCEAGHAQGNILFYRADDREFLARAVLALAEMLPGADRAALLG